MVHIINPCGENIYFINCTQSICKKIYPSIVRGQIILSSNMGDEIYNLYKKTKQTCKIWNYFQLSKKIKFEALILLIKYLYWYVYLYFIFLKQTICVCIRTLLLYMINLLFLLSIGSTDITDISFFDIYC